jgi:tetraacyldisaccharide 4'-kinase
MSLRDAMLQPLALLYESGARIRAVAYDSGFLSQRRLEGCVISIGNLTVGGTGKTPMVLWIAERLLSEGKNVGILTRGYRGKASTGSVDRSAPDGKVSAGDKGGGTTSDEVRMLKVRLGERVVFGVGPDRFANGKRLSARGVDWFLLDDGFQHRRLARDVDIVLVDATNPFGGGHLLPVGRLREPRSALSRADVIVITRSGHAPAIEAAVRHDSTAPIFYARATLDSIQLFGFGSLQEAVNIEAARAEKLFAFCGIGNPAAFVDDLRDWGLHVVGHKFFRDHHHYTQQDVDEIEKAAQNAGATSLICTEKDIFNFGEVQQPALRVLYCRISLRVDREAEFWSAVLAKAGARRRNAT